MALFVRQSNHLDTLIRILAREIDRIDDNATIPVLFVRNRVYEKYLLRRLVEFGASFLLGRRYYTIESLFDIFSEDMEQSGINAKFVSQHVIFEGIYSMLGDCRENSFSDALATIIASLDDDDSRMRARKLWGFATACASDIIRCRSYVPKYLKSDLGWLSELYASVVERWKERKKDYQYFVDPDSLAFHPRNDGVFDSIVIFDCCDFGEAGSKLIDIFKDYRDVYVYSLSPRKEIDTDSFEDYLNNFEKYRIFGNEGREEREFRPNNAVYARFGILAEKASRHFLPIADDNLYEEKEDDQAHCLARLRQAIFENLPIESFLDENKNLSDDSLTFKVFSSLKDEVADVFADIDKKIRNDAALNEKDFSIYVQNAQDGMVTACLKEMAQGRAPLSFVTHGLESRYRLFDAFRLLLKILSSVPKRSDIAAFLSHPCVISDRNVSFVVEKLCDKYGIYRSLIAEDLGEEDYAGGHYYHWEQALESFLSSTLSLKEGENFERRRPDFIDIEDEDKKLAFKVMAVVSSLAEDKKYLAEHSEKGLKDFSGADWINVFQALLRHYIETDDTNDKIAFETLERIIRLLPAKLPMEMSEAFALLEIRIESFKLESGANFEPGIPVYAFEEDSLLPAKYIYVIGADDSVVLGDEKYDELTAKINPYTKRDKHKSAILRSIFFAERKLSFSCTALNPVRGDERLPDDEIAALARILNGNFVEQKQEKAFSSFRKAHDFVASYGHSPATTAEFRRVSEEIEKQQRGAADILKMYAEAADLPCDTFCRAGKKREKHHISLGDVAAFLLDSSDFHKSVATRVRKDRKIILNDDFENLDQRFLNYSAVLQGVLLAEGKSFDEKIANFPLEALLSADRAIGKSPNAFYGDVVGAQYRLAIDEFFDMVAAFEHENSLSINPNFSRLFSGAYAKNTIENTFGRRLFEKQSESLDETECAALENLSDTLSIGGEFLPRNRDFYIYIPHRYKALKSDVKSSDVKSCMDIYMTVTVSLLAEVATGRTLKRNVLVILGKTYKNRYLWLSTEKLQGENPLPEILAQIADGDHDLPVKAKDMWDAFEKGKKNGDLERSVREYLRGVATEEEEKRNRAKICFNDALTEKTIARYKRIFDICADLEPEEQRETKKSRRKE